MKNIPILCLFMAFSFIGHTQVFDFAVRYRAPLLSFYDAADTLIARVIAEDPADTTEAGEVVELKRWKDYMGKRICNDVSAGADMIAPYSMALSSYASSGGAYCTGGSATPWTCIGPNINYFGSSNETQGRVNAIWVNPCSP